MCCRDVCYSLAGFDSSFYYYERDLKVLDGIYADAITKLTLMRGEPIEGANEDYDEE